MNPRTLFLKLLFCLGIYSSQAQSINFYHIHNGVFESKELIFAYWDLDDEEIAESEEISCNYELVESQVEGHRAQIIELVNNYWVLTPKRILPYKQALSLIAGNPDRYLLGIYGMGPYHKESKQYVDQILAGELRILSFSKQAFLEKKLVDTKVVRLFSSANPAEPDFVYALLTAQFVIRGVQKERIIRESAWIQSPQAAGARLDSKVLMISKEAMGQITPNELKSLYPFEFKIVSEKQLRQAILQRDTRHLVLYIRKQSDDFTYHPSKMIYDPTDGAILAYSFPLVGKKYIGTEEKLIAQDLKKFSKNWVID
ncbi:MAG: hypothetical protein AAFR87_00075 [Bacteroidota bacterium]